MSLMLAFSAGGCFDTAYHAAPRHEGLDELDPPPTTEAYKYLASKEGPVRFARVVGTVYRGGQPTKEDLQKLYDLGVRTDINLRREDEDTWRQEERNAKAVGMTFLHFPFYGVFGAEDSFLKPIIAAMKKGHVYVHCLHGRDRTSLMVALYRVLVEDWDPKIAWKLEAIDYGSAQTYWYRKLRFDFERMVKEHADEQARRESHPAKAAEKMTAPVAAPPEASPAPTHAPPASKEPPGDRK